MSNIIKGTRIVHGSNSLGNWQSGYPDRKSMLAIGARLVSYKPFGNTDIYDLVWDVPSMQAYHKARREAEAALQEAKRQVREADAIRCRVRDYRRTR
jgi:hypothetical protein